MSLVLAPPACARSHALTTSHTRSDEYARPHASILHSPPSASPLLPLAARSEPASSSSSIKRKLQLDAPEHISAVTSAAAGFVAAAASQASHSTNGSLVRVSSRSHKLHTHKRRKVHLDERDRTRFFAAFDHLHSQLDDEADTSVDATTISDASSTRPPLAAANYSLHSTLLADDIDMHSTISASSLPALEGTSAVTVPAALPPIEEDDSMSPPPLEQPTQPSSTAHIAALHALSCAPLQPPIIPPAAAPVPSSLWASTPLPTAQLPPLHRAKTATPHTSSSTPDIAPSTSLSLSVPNSPLKTRVPPEIVRTSANLFEGFRIVLLQGRELTGKRCELLITQIARRGGKVTSIAIDAPNEPPKSGKQLTHVLFGGLGDADGRVHEYARFLQKHLKPKNFDAIKFLSVEWLTSCLKKNALAREKRYLWSIHRTPAPTLPQLVPLSPSSAIGLTPSVDTVPPFPTSFDSAYPHSLADPSTAAPAAAAASSFALPADSSHALSVAATGPKRDIAYVMEAMKRQQHQAQITAAAAAAAQVKTEPLPTPTHINGVKIEVAPDKILDEEVLRKAKREMAHKRGQPWKKRDAAGSTTAAATEASTTTATASSDTTSPHTLALAQTYMQSVPTFTEAVPYNEKTYLPLSSGASYLNPDLPVAPGASFLKQAHNSDGASRTTAGLDTIQEDDNATMAEETASHAAAGAAAAAAPPAAVNIVNFHPLPSAAKAGAWIDRNKAHLACQIFSSQHRNLNAHITSFLEKLENMNGSIGDKWRTYAYRKAVGILRKYPHKIETQEDVLKLAGIRGLGSKMLKKISEIVATGALHKVESMSQNEQIKTMALFSAIHGVGSATAQKWYTWGLRSIEQLLTDPRVELNAVQKVGLQFMEDKKQRIPRLEVTSILDYVSRIANRILPGVTVICCGSFRRGAPTSGDVDLLFTHPTFTTREMGNDADDPVSVRQREAFLKKIIAVLHEPLVEGTPRWEEEKTWSTAKYASVKEECEKIKREMKKEKDPSPAPVAAAAASSAAAAAAASSAPPPLVEGGIVRSNNPALRPSNRTSFITGDLNTFEKLSSRHGSAYFMGFCRLPKFHPFYSGVHRRIDMKVYPASHFPFALLYFTGSDHFNRSMRFFAKKKQWTLSDHGLKPAIRVNGDKVWSGKSVYCATEKDIFDALGLLYVPPEQRNVYAHFELSEEEQRILKQNNILQAGQLPDDDQSDSKSVVSMASALVPAPGVAAAASSASSSSPVLNPLGFPLKQEVIDELAEMDEVERAIIGLKRLQEEEAAILQNQLANLDTAKTKQV